MNKKKNGQAIPPLSRRAKEEDVIKWTAAHDVFDRLDAGVAEIVDERQDLDALLEVALKQRNTAQLTMRIPPAMKAALGHLARERTTDVTTLARMWLAERLQQELKTQD